MTTITVTWMAFCHPDTPHRVATSATIETDIKGRHIDIAESVFRDTNLYQGTLWKLLEPVLPANRTHTALSVGDAVTIDGITYRCASEGWELVVSSDKENK